MAEYAFYSFQDETLLSLGMEPTPMPVRREMEGEVFGGEKVRVDLLIDELIHFLNEYPDLRDLYAGTMEVFTYLARVNSSMEGDAEAAAIYLEMGLEANPDSLLLRSNYALALQMQGKSGEALEQYRIVLADPEGRENPVVVLLAARLLGEQEEYLEAYRLLDGMARGLPPDDDFWDFLAEMKELAGLAGVEQEEPVVEAGMKEVEYSAPAPSCPACGKEVKPGAGFCRSCGEELAHKKPGPLICSTCGKELAEGLSFCNACGKSVRREEPRPAFCPGCGNRLREGASFCRECGRRL